MEGICLINCTDALPKRYDEGLCEPIFRKFGYDQFVAFKCGIEFTDIMDVAEWTTKIQAGDIIASPGFGMFELGETTDSTIENGCGKTFAEFSETPWSFSTPSTKEDYSDEDWWYMFQKAARGYTLGYLNCDGRIYLNKEAITAIKAGGGAVSLKNPGLEMDLTSTPKFTEGPNGKGKAGLWKVEGKFIHKGVFRSAEIPGLKAALADSTP